MKDLIIIKIGGSLITDKKSSIPKADLHNLEFISVEIAKCLKENETSLVIVHGAGSFGHGIVKESGIDKGIRENEQLLSFAKTQRLQNKLNVIVTDYLIKAGLAAFACQPSSFTLMDKGRVVRMDLSVIEGLLDISTIPVLYGVPAYDASLGCSILSGDQIVSYLALKLSAKRIIHATNVNGVFTSDPNKDPQAKLIPEINKSNFKEIEKSLGGSLAVDVTGGMLGKVKETMKAGVESYIIDATIPNNILKAFKGEEAGTLIKPCGKID